MLKASEMKLERSTVRSFNTLKGRYVATRSAAVEGIWRVIAPDGTCCAYVLSLERVKQAIADHYNGSIEVRSDSE